MSNLRLVGYVIAVTVLVLSAIWFLTKPDFEPAITFFGALLTIAGLLASDSSKDFDRLVASMRSLNRTVVGIAGILLGILLTLVATRIFSTITTMTSPPSTPMATVAAIISTTAAPTDSVLPTTLPAASINTTNPTLAPSPTHTSTLTVAPTPEPSTHTATPTPECKPGCVLYQADWSSGRQGWAGPQDWKTVDAMLINNGQSASTLRAPYETGDITDYAVEAEIQMITQPSAFVAFQTLFGIFGRASEEGAYWAGFDADFCGYGGHAYVYPSREVRGCSNPTIGWSPFKQDSEWHTYRLEMKGNKIQLLVDGSVMVSQVDNTYLSGSQVGVWSQKCQINVRSFKVIKL